MAAQVTRKFVGINSEITVMADGTRIEPESTLDFMTQTKPDGPYSEHVHVTFDIKEFCQTRLKGGFDKKGQPAKLSWYSHWRLDEAGEVVYTNKNGTLRDNAGPSVASKYQLSHLQQQNLRESKQFQDFVDASDFSEADKISLKHFAKSHGSTRDGATQTPLEAAQSTIDKIAPSMAEIANDAGIEPVDKNHLADALQAIIDTAITNLREPYSVEAKYNAKTAELETAVETAEADLQAVLNMEGDNQKVSKLFRKAGNAINAAKQALADHLASEPTPEPAADSTEQTEPAPEQTEPAPEPAAETDTPNPAEPTA